MDFSQGGTVRVLRTRVCPGWHGEGQAGDCAVQEGDAAACGENSEARGGVEAVAVLWAAAGYEVCREKGKTFFAQAQIGDVCCSIEFVDDHLEDLVGELSQVCVVVFVLGFV